MGLGSEGQRQKQVLILCLAQCVGNKTFKTHMPFQSVLSLLGKKNKYAKGIYCEVCNSKKKWEQSKCSSAGASVNTVQYLLAMEYYTAINTNKVNHTCNAITVY